MNSDNQTRETQLTFLDTQPTTFNRHRINPKYLFDLPFDVRREFCNLLDADKSWRELGGKFIGLNETDLELYSHAIMRNESPTNTMLSKWEQSNVTIVHLYKCLAIMKHLRAMTILKPFVDTRLHYLCDYNELNTIVTLNEVKEHQNVNANFPPNNNAQSNNLQNIRLVVDAHHAKDEMKLRDAVDAPNNNNNLKVNDKLNVNQLKQYQIPSQVPSAVPKGCESRFSAVASTINAYEDNLPYEEILTATNHFHISNVIGSGGFGVVYKGQWKGTKVAIKRLKDCGNFAQAITELRVLSQYRIDNIVPLYGISIGGNEACLVYQFLINGSLDDRLQCKRNSQPLTWPQRINIGLGVAKALNYLHTRKGKPLIHGDVKSANILLDAQMQAKLGDFGLGMKITKLNPQCDSDHTEDYQSTQSSVSSALNARKNLTHITVSTVHGTVAYLPLEYLRSKILSPAVDVYSYGVVQLEMLTGCRAFDGKSLLLDKITDELDEASNGKLSKHCQLLGEFGNLVSVKSQKATHLDVLCAVPSMDKFNSKTCCLSCRLYKFHDTKLPHTLESLFWFHCTLKLALDCCNKLKKKRPDFAAILKSYETYIDQFKQFNTCNQIFNLTGINTNRNSIVSKVSTFQDDDAIKTPLEYKLWHEMKKKNATAPPLPESDSNDDEQSDRSTKQHSDPIEQLLISLSMNKSNVDDVSVKQLESSSTKDESIVDQSNNDECVNEFVENCDLPLLTELGVNSVRKEN